MVYKLRAAKLTLVSSVRTVFLNFPASFICFPASLVWLSGVSQMALYHKVDLNCSEKLLKALLCKGLQPHLHFLSFWKAFFFFYVGCFFTLCAEMEEIWQMEEKTRPSLENVAVTKPFLRMSSQTQRKTKVWQIPPKLNWKSVGADLI